MAPARRRSTEELVARKPAPAAFRALRRASLQLVLVDVRGLANVGLVFRLADNLRAGHLWLCGATGHPGRTDDPRPPAIVARCTREIEKTAVMALPFVPWSYAADAVEVVRARRDAGDRIVVLEQAEGAVPLERACLDGPLCLVLGHERRGVPAAVIALAHELIELPTYGMANSLNVAMSAAIVGYEAARRSGGFGLPPL